MPRTRDDIGQSVAAIAATLGIQFDDQDSIDRLKRDLAWARIQRELSDDRARERSKAPIVAIVSAAAGAAAIWLSDLVHLGHGR